LRPTHFCRDSIVENGDLNFLRKVSMEQGQLEALRFELSCEGLG
jgi:hypothetical protein